MTSPTVEGARGAAWMFQRSDSHEGEKEKTQCNLVITHTQVSMF